MLLSLLAGSIALALVGPLCWKYFGFMEPRWASDLRKRKELNNV